MRKKCKRKVWNKINTIAYVLEGIRPTEGAKLDKLRTLELSALEAFRIGQASIYDWQHLTDMMNVAENMATNGVGIEVLPFCEEAGKHLLEAAKRYKKTQKLGFTGPALQALRELYEYHDLQRTSVSLIEYEHFIRDTVNRIRSDAPEVVDVLEVA